MFLLQSAIQFPAHVSVYDPDASCSASYFTKNFTQGDFGDAEAVKAFGVSCDVVMFETESTSAEALLALESEGKMVWSNPHSLEWIRDKGVQRQKLADAGFPVPEFSLVGADEVANYQGPYPIVQKWRQGGYDGQGVQILKSADDLSKAQAVDSVFESLVDIQMELSVIVARDASGQMAVYPPIEMVFDPEANLVDYLVAPARISPELTQKVIELSQQMAEQLEFRGIYAIELFLTRDGEILVNEIAPRPHNSGHHTLSANVTSQYEQQIRMALGLPLGSTEMLSPCVMVNLLGEGESGPTNYVGLEKAFTIPNVQYMLYGKSEVRPFRKMGHALILESDFDTAFERLAAIRQSLHIRRHE